MQGMRAALLTWLIVVSTVQADARGMVAEVRALLEAGVEETVSPEQLARLGPDVSTALVAVYETRDAPRHVRLRAVTALGRRSDEAASHFLLKLLHAGTQRAPALGDPLHPARSALVLRRAIEGLTLRRLSAAEADLTLSLSHRDTWVRSAAVKALSAYANPATERSLTLHLERETSARVRRLITDRSAPRAAPRANAPGSATPPR